MKTYIPYSILAAIAACGLASAQTAYTTPVGYVTQNLSPNKFTFLGLTVHNPVVSAGVISAVSASPSSVTISGVDFSTLLTTGATYVLELNDGTIQEVTGWNSQGVLNTPEDLSSRVTANVTTLKLRRASTVSDVFGVNNSAGLTPDTDDNFNVGNDLLFVINGVGSAVVIYYSAGGAEAPAGWYTASGEPAGNIPIVYSDGFYVKRGNGTSIPLVVSGEVKTHPTAGVLFPNFTYLSSTAPVGLTLANSGLENSLSKSANGASFNTVDNVYIPTPTGFIIAYYSTGGEEALAGWYTSSDTDAGSLSLEGGFLIRNRGASKAYKLNVPTSYSTL